MRRTQEHNNTKGRAKGAVIVIIAILIVLSATQIFLAARVATTGEEITQLQNKRDELILKRKRLEAEINKVSSLPYIEQKAREDLGMVSAIGRIAYLKRPPVDYFASARNR